jgi:opacity protein-like surface antigen
MDGSSACPVALIGCNTEIDHFWRVGGRAGVAFGATGNWLLYGAGGFARANVESATTVLGTSDKTHHHGWYGGVGLDWGLAPNFILGVEAYHVSLGSQRHFQPGGIVIPFNTRDIDLDFSVVQARATYLFNWGGPLVARY